MQLKKTLAAAAVLVATAAPAFATQAWSDYRFWDWDGAYVSAKGGWEWQSDEHFGDGLKGDMNGKYTVDGAIGYQVRQGVRGELEVGYKKADLDSVFTRTTGTNVGSDGENKTLTLMANGYYDLNLAQMGILPGYANMLTPYLGAGVGAAHVRFDDYGPELAGQSPNDTDWVLAYQAMAGLAVNFTPNVSVTAEYRFFDTTNAEFHGQGARIKSNELLGGLKFKY